MKKNIFLIMLCMLSLLNCTKKNGITNEYVIRGEKFYYDLELDIALSQFQEAININPEIAEAYAGLGKVYYTYMEYERSIDEFLKAAKYNPKYLYFVRGINANRKGNYKDALSEFNDAIRDKFELVIAYDFRASVYVEMGEYDKAMEDFSRILELSPDYLYAYIGRGICYMQKTEFDKAINEINESIKRNPHNYFNLLWRGTCNYSMWELEKSFGNQERAAIFIEKANIDFDEALNREPVYIGDYYLFGTVYYMVKEEYERSIEYLLNAIRSDKGLFEAYNLLGDTYQKNKNLELAFNNQNEAIRLNPNYASAYSSRASVYMEMNDTGKAIEDYKTVIRLKPNSPIGYMELGTLYLNQVNFTDARKMFVESQRCAPNSFVSNYILGSILSIDGQNKKALPYYVKALQLVPYSLDVKSQIQFQIDSINNSKNFETKVNGDQFTILMEDGREFAKGTITIIGSKTVLSITHMFDVGTNSLITKEEFLRHSLDLGLSDELVHFFEEEFSKIIR